MSESFDILVVGAGPAGVAAAVTAAACGQRVGLVDDNPAAGGQIWRKGPSLPPAARAWLARLDAAGVVRLQGWRIFDAIRPTIVLAERNATGAGSETAELRTQKLILCTGARERFVPFPGWTLPNVTGAGGLDALARGGLPVAGKRVVVAGTGPLLLAVAAHLAECGAEIVAVCEQASLQQLAPFGIRMLRQPGKLWQGALYRRAMQTGLLTGCWVVAAHGENRLDAVTLRQGSRKWDLRCDFLACGYHLVANTELFSLLGCRIEHGLVTTDRWLQTSVPNVYSAGEPTGIGGVELAILEGQIAALAACGRTSEAEPLAKQRRRNLGFVHALEQACRLRPELRALPNEETIVCRCEDVHLGALRRRTNWRDAKLQTRCGMGPCQGRICGPATEFLLGWHPESVRPPMFPASVQSLTVVASPERTTAETNHRKEAKEEV